MLLLEHGMTVAAHHQVVEAGVLHVIRNAVLAVIAIFFVIGGVLGFMLGKAVGRRQR